MNELTINFPSDFGARYSRYLEEKGFKNTNPGSKPSTQHKEDLLYKKDLTVEIVAGNLEAYSDGTIRYKGEILPLRNQLKDLCRMFMRHQQRTLTRDDILENIIDADQRKTLSKTTISKYVSELHNSLKIHFKKNVIYSQKREGWYFNPDK